MSNSKINFAPAVDFLQTKNFISFEKKSLAAWTHVCQKINLYPNPQPADYEYRAEYVMFAGEKLSARLVSVDLGPRINMNLAPHLRLTGVLEQAIISRARRRPVEVLRLTISWEGQLHSQTSPENNPGQKTVIPVAQMVFDGPGNLAAARLAIRSPQMIKINTQLTAIAREIVYYKNAGSCGHATGPPSGILIKKFKAGVRRKTQSPPKG